MPIIKDRALTPLFCKNAPVGFHCDGGGLYLSVKPLKDGEGVSRSWIFRYRRLGRLRDLGLGPMTTVGLAAARDRARQARQKLLDGLDPIEERRAARVAAAITAARAMTFEQCAEGYIEANRSGWKNEKHAGQWRATLLTYAYPVIGSLPVDAVETVHVMKILEPIWSSKTETASRVRGRVEKVLDRARALKLRTGENPARWTGHLDHLLPAKSQVAPVKHHEALPYTDLPRFMAELRQRDSLSARALEFTILTAARTGDTIGAVRSEIDREKGLWTVPAGRLKGKKGARVRDHVVPLSDRALQILDGLPEQSRYLFANEEGEPLSNMAMLELLRGMGFGEGLTVHGFRSTFKDCVFRGDRVSERDVGDGAGAHSLRQGRGGVPARRHAGEAPPHDVGLGDLRSESRRGFALADRANQVRNLGLNDASHIISIFHKRVNTRWGRASTP